MAKNFINDEQKGNVSLWNKDLWKQKEVADYFGVTSNTVKNWRERGLISYFQAPGSTRKQYFRDGIRQFIKTNSVSKVIDNRRELERRLQKESGNKISFDYSSLDSILKNRFDLDAERIFLKVNEKIDKLKTLF